MKAKISKMIGEYRWASSALILDKRHQELFKHSLLLKEDIWSILDNKLTNKDYQLFDTFQKTVYRQEAEETIRPKQKSLDDFLGDYETTDERNKKILEAIADGYKQSEIAQYLGLTSAGVSYVVNR
jgi:DNA-binding NarL/FixJ family response regulator